MQSGRLANLARGIALLFSVAAAYFAQYLYIRDSISALLPAWLVNAFPFLSRFLYRPASGMLIAVLWTFVVAAFIFGFVTPVRDRYRSRTDEHTQPSELGAKSDASTGAAQTISGVPANAGVAPSFLRTNASAWRLPLAAAGALVLVAALLLAFTPVSWLAYVLQACAAGLYLWAGYERQRTEPSPAMLKVLSSLSALPQNPATDVIYRTIGTERSAALATSEQTSALYGRSDAAYGHSDVAYGHSERSEESRALEAGTLRFAQGDTGGGEDTDADVTCDTGGGTNDSGHADSDDAASPSDDTVDPPDGIGPIAINDHTAAWLSHIRALVSDRDGAPVLKPPDGWPYLVAILVLAAIAYVLRWLGAPSNIDSISAETGLIAQGHADAAARTLMNASNVPSLSATVATFFTRLTGDGLVGIRMAGLYAGVLLTLAVWLLASELFPRTSSVPLHGLDIDDDLLLRMLAAAIAAFGIPVLYFSRVPVVLEGVAWGSLGIWALLVGLRSGRLLAVGSSAILLGASTYFGPNGLVLIAVGLAIWAGARILAPEWLALGPGEGDASHRRALVYWSLGLGLLLVPLIAWWMGPRAAFGPYLSFQAALDGTQTSLFVRIGSNAPMSIGIAASDMLGALLAPSLSPGAAGLLGIDAAMLSAVIAPFYILGLGVLVLSVDSFEAWTLLGWLLLGAALSVLYAYPLAPHWSSLVVMWPAIALTTALALDRLRAAITECTGDWTRAASLYFGAGLVIAAAILGWLTFQEASLHNIDTASAAGRQVRRAIRSGEPAFVATTVTWTDGDRVVLAFLAGNDLASADAMLTGADALSSLTTADGASMRAIVRGDDTAALQELQRLYPSVTPHVYRDVLGNPVAYVVVDGVEE